MQKVSIRRQYCGVCNEKTKHERHITAMGCGDLILVIATWGLWLPVRWLFLPSFKCSVCGSGAKKNVKKL